MASLFSPLLPYYARQDSARGLGDLHAHVHAYSQLLLQHTSAQVCHLVVGDTHLHLGKT